MASGRDPARLPLLNNVLAGWTLDRVESLASPAAAAAFYRARAERFLAHACKARSPHSREMYRRLAARDSRLARQAERDADRVGPGHAAARAAISDRDIFYGALLIMDRHGDDAALQAAARADRVRRQGDACNAALWRRIAVAIEELRRSRREGEAVN